MTVCLSISLPLPTCLPVCLSVCHSTLHSIDSLSSSSLSFPFHQSSLLSACLSVCLSCYTQLSPLLLFRPLPPFIHFSSLSSLLPSLSPFHPTSLFLPFTCHSMSSQSPHFLFLFLSFFHPSCCPFPAFLSFHFPFSLNPAHTKVYWRPAAVKSLPVSPYL